MATKIAGDPTHPDLQALLSQGSEQAKQWEARLTDALQKLSVDDSPIENEIIKAHYAVSKKILQQADTPEVRDLGIIASGQLVMHYYIAGLGTLSTYAKKMGNNAVGTMVGELLNQAKESDEAMTQIAQKILTCQTFGGMIDEMCISNRVCDPEWYLKGAIRYLSYAYSRSRKGPPC